MSDVSLDRYIAGLSVRTRENRRGVLLRFFGFCGVGPSEAVGWQREHPGDYRFVDLAYRWLDEGRLMASTKRTHMGTVRGLFISNRCPLPIDRHRFRSEKVPVFGDLSVEEFKKILVACNLNYRACFLCMFQSGSGVGELCYLNERHADFVFGEVQKGRDVICFDLPGRKQSRNIHPYYSMVGGDTVEALRRLFYSRGWRKSEFLFYTEKGEPVSRQSLTAYFRRMALRLGLVKAWSPPCLDCGGETVKRVMMRDLVERTYYICTVCHRERVSSEYNVGRARYSGVRYRMKTHEIRDLFRTEWHRAQTYAGVDPALGEFLMGHSVDPLQYDKIMRDKKYALEQYRKALPWLNVLSENPRVVDRSEVQDQLEAQRAQSEAVAEKMVKLEKELAEIRDALKRTDWDKKE